MQRNQIIKILIIVLVIFNLLQWWPDNNKEINDEEWREIKVSHLNLNGVNINAIRHKNIRDLFYADEVVVAAKVEITGIPKNKDTSRSLSDIKLLGVVFKNKHYEAFIIKGEERYKVSVNNYITRDYQVKHIDINSMKLKDMNTGYTHKIILSEQ